MMGHREKFKGGDEWDALSKRSRRLLRWQKGAIRKIKRAYWKRIRKQWKEQNR